jgi:hypothetical protein
MEDAEQLVIEFPFDASANEEIVIGEDAAPQVRDLLPRVTFAF